MWKVTGFRPGMHFHKFDDAMKLQVDVIARSPAWGGTTKQSHSRPPKIASSARGGLAMT